MEVKQKLHEKFTYLDIVLASRQRKANQGYTIDSNNLRAKKWGR